MFRSLFIYVLIFFCFDPVQSNAQLTASDSLFFTDLFQYYLYSNYQVYPGNFYVHEEVTSKAKLYEQLHGDFKFGIPDYYGSYQKIRVDTTLIPLDSINNTNNLYYNADTTQMFQQLNPCFKLPFRLNGIRSDAYTIFTPCTQANLPERTAFLIIPGSEDNSAINLVRNASYHTIYCDAKNYLKEYGDVYTQTKPLNDFRSIYWNVKKIEAEFSQGPYLYTLNYLNGIGKQYGINIVLEAEALIKMMKQKYDRVYVLGLSHGGFIAYFASLEAEPDALEYSGGTHCDFQTYQNQQKDFGNLMDMFLADSMKKLLPQKNTRFLFSVAVNDHPELIDSGMFSLPNVFFDFDKILHSFPKCYVHNLLMDTVAKYAKPYIQTISMGCDPLFADIRIRFKGKKPYHFNLFKDGVMYNHYTSFTDTMLLSLTQTGVYQVRDLVDNTGRPGYKSELYTFQPHSQVHMDLEESEYLCNSDRYKLFYNLSGSPMWNISYSCGQWDTLIQNHHSDSLVFWWKPGQYIFNSISDKSGCTVVLNDTVTLADPPSVADIFVSDVKNCDSVDFDLTLSNSFSKASELYFLKNNLPDSLPFVEGRVRMSDADYHLQYIRYSNGCEVPINQDFSPGEATDIEFVSTQPDCIHKEHLSSVKLSGRFPWTMMYVLNNSLYTKQFTEKYPEFTSTPGIYNFVQLTDGSGCVHLINTIDTLEPFLDSVPPLEIHNYQLQILRGPLQYAWYRDGKVLAGETRSTAPLYGDGQYYVRLTDSAGCQYRSDTISVQFPSLLSVYPNPVQTNSINLLVNESSPWSYQVRDINGNTLLSGSSTQPYREIDISHLKAATYFIVVQIHSDAGERKLLGRFLRM